MCRTLKQEPGRAHEVHCSRERSRAAWGVIEEVTFKLKGQLSLCDMFLKLSDVHDCG